MKYSEDNKPFVCMMTNSTCYKGTSIGKPVGILWHSTGCNNSNLSRYVQPSDNDKNREKLLSIIGKNQYNNDWNHTNVQAGLNAWIGKLANGEVTTIQTMPWNYRPWGCGSGKNGSCNGKTGGPTWLQFEICEDGLNDKNYFDKCYKEACELTAYLCKMFNINPNGTVDYNGLKVPTILCHWDSYNLGLGSSHYDVYNWFNKYNKTMQDVRNDVKNILEDDDMTQEKFNEMMNTWIKEQSNKKPDDWSAEDRQWAEENNIINGDSSGNKMYKKYVTREEMAAMLHRANAVSKPRPRKKTTTE